MTALEDKKLDLTKPSVFWVSQLQKAFDILKIALTMAPVLGYPDFNREFILETDV